MLNKFIPDLYYFIQQKLQLILLYISFTQQKNDLVLLWDIKFMSLHSFKHKILLIVRTNILILL